LGENKRVEWERQSYAGMERVHSMGWAEGSERTTTEPLNTFGEAE
jgi:hypothetical protein